MPNVPETPNFEAIIQLLSITNSEAGFQLQAPVDIGGQFDNTVALSKDAGIPQGLIQVSEFSLGADGGIPQGLVEVSEFNLTEQGVTNPLSDVLSITENVNVVIPEQDFGLEIDGSVSFLIDDLSLAASDVSKLSDDFTLLVFDDVRILVSDVPENEPSSDDNLFVQQQELLLNVFRICKPIYGCKPKTRHSVR